MSKKIEQISSWGYGYVLGDNAPDMIIGKVITLIEVLGLSETQEKSLKDLVKQSIREVFYDAVFIKPERHTAIREEFYKQRSENKTGLPTSAI